MDVLPLAFQHGSLRVFGYRFDRIAYITDIKEIPGRAGTAARARRAGAQRAVVATSSDSFEYR